MEKNLILKEILGQNKHWKGDDSFFEAQKHKRKLFAKLIGYIADRQIISVVGIRRTGKTILLKQLIKYLIGEKKVDPKNILFLSFDEALVTGKLTLKKYLDAYLEQANGQSKEKKFIFLDEIQYVAKWQHILKRYYDSSPDMKFFISGSSSLFIQKKATESLAGRIYEFNLLPLSFEEFLELAEVDVRMLEKYQAYAVSAGKIIPAEKIKEYGLFLAEYENVLERLFEEYLYFHQFPEMAKEGNAEKIRKYIAEAVYKKTIEYDIPRLFGVEKIEELKFVFQILVNENGNLIELGRIASEAGIEENTLKKYISYFQESFLFHIVYNYSRSFRKSRRLQKKGYVSSTNFFAVFHAEYAENAILKSQHIGRLAETYIGNILKNKYQFVSFFRKGNKEIDFAAGNDYLDKKSLALFEVKYVNQLRRDELKFISEMAEKFGKPHFVYTKKDFKIDGEKIILPCFLVK